FLFLEHLDDLFVAESRLHLSVLWLVGLYTKLEEIQGLRSVSLRGANHARVPQGRFFLPVALRGLLGLP
ncbi:MAG: hypothetical protein AAF631_13180, partial [Pseudomonadota bacterium]